MPPGRGRSPPVGLGALCSEVPDVPAVPVSPPRSEPPERRAPASGGRRSGVGPRPGGRAGARRGPARAAAVAAARGPGRGAGRAWDRNRRRGAVRRRSTPRIAGGAGARSAAGAGAGRGARSGPTAPPPLPPPDMESRSLRATGASTVEDADLTNSPRDSSCVSTCLLVTPSSFASSCTRALPATDLLILEVGGGPATSCLRLCLHRKGFTAGSWGSTCFLIRTRRSSRWSVQPGGSGAGVRVEQCVQGPGVERPRDAQRPGERRPALRAVQAARLGVHPRTSTGLPTPRVGIDDPVRGHHS